jgi:hypothetical protein
MRRNANSQQHSVLAAASGLSAWRYKRPLCRCFRLFFSFTQSFTSHNYCHLFQLQSTISSTTALLHLLRIPSKPSCRSIATSPLHESPSCLSANTTPQCLQARTLTVRPPRVPTPVCCLVCIQILDMTLTDTAYSNVSSSSSLYAHSTNSSRNKRYGNKPPVIHNGGGQSYDDNTSSSAPNGSYHN